MGKLLENVNLRIPIIQAGMAGGITTPKLVAEVANAGGLGTIGAGYMSASSLRDEIDQVKQLTDKPFAVNLFATNLEAFSSDVEQMQHFLNKYREELEIDSGNQSVKIYDYLQEKVYVIIEKDIPVVSTAFGVLSSVLIERLKKNDVTLIGMATNLEEANQLVEAGYDIIVAQGFEAGGHRGTFDVVRYPNGCNLGLLSMVQEFLENLDVPIVAAGGISNKSQIDVLMAMGVSGVQLGTKFLVAKEAGTNTAYRRSLLKASAVDTVITSAFSGRPARAIMNRFIGEVEVSGFDLLPFPIQNELTKDIRGASKDFAVSEFQSLWAGQGVGSIVNEETVAEILVSLIDEPTTDTNQLELEFEES
ncbi:NAD(P)H-dependent flavin oxidoreductase [Virgibacillus necropolis]|uniref:Probable nitronate monooxygenase n=1 Tax=Virgibacillus necropolis TaxID=163877 RepID=A0A221M8K2_9BACI|nr:nitronate monooxygenase [Virgibacillus necropolis]ASN03960.1 2-nitropropane dioxygenase [Virgibacillus necropolis]